MFDLIKTIYDGFELIRSNHEMDVDNFFARKYKFNVKNEDFKSEKNLKTHEIFLFLQEIEKTYDEIFQFIEKLMNLISEFSHQKYFNQFLLG